LKTIVIYPRVVNVAFMDVFESLTEDICSELAPKYEMTPEAVKAVENMIRYNVPKGKLNRGLTVVHT
jgi:hypothetical protein